MRSLLILLLALATTVMAVAQQPWGELSEKQQRRTIEAKQTPKELRAAMTHLGDLTAEEREVLWTIVSQRASSKRQASLYLYIYELLRPSNGSVAEADIAMLRAYPKYMLRRWGEDDHLYDLYSYAYAVGSYAAVHNDAKLLQSVDRSLAKGSSRGTRSLAERFGYCAEVARRSVALGLMVEPDFTPVNTYDAQIEQISRAEFEAQPNIYPKFEDKFSGDNEDEVIMAEECIRYDGGYYVAVEHNLGEGMSVAIRWGFYDANILLTDKAWQCYTLPYYCYVQPTGEFFAFDISNGWTLRTIVVGSIADGIVEVKGAVPQGDAKLIEIKCNDRGVLFGVEQEEGDVRYYLIPAL